MTVRASGIVQLRVNELVAHEVWEEDDAMLSANALGPRDVGIDCCGELGGFVLPAGKSILTSTDRVDTTLCLSLMLVRDEATLIRPVRSHVV